MTLPPGVYTSKKKDGTIYYRASITYKNKHISLGSFLKESDAAKTYLDAQKVIKSHYEIEDYNNDFRLSFGKFICLLNFKNSGIYFKNPVYLLPKFFLYYFSPHEIFMFDKEDLFYYGTHKIQKRGGYLFVCDYGSQYGILSRYGIQPFSVKGRDYIFVNQNDHDYRYENIKVINHYMGVTQKSHKNKPMYEAVIHIKGNYVIGKYPDEISAAIAYNKAVDTLQANGFKKRYIKNYIEKLDRDAYQQCYDSLSISKKLENLKPN